jgi:chromosome segregation protein
VRLKQLELQGFKTFASKTEFVFPTGITAIVGPNGSGKSNVADAVRWVLGEQSYSLLRGKRTEDMIFAGSEQRTRAGMAEALLTLDNSEGWLPVEFTDVVIGRRAYRSGENEYYLNGSRVRLKDVTEILGASGLARRTYAVIGQGLVDQALSLRPEERRELFEEAAGIAHYQSKRDESLKKLDETQRNLERVRDILAEIGPRLRALHRQSERSQQYERLVGELRDLQRTWYAYHWGHAQEALHVARQASDVQRKLLAERQQDLASLGDRLNQLRAEQAGLRTKLVEWQKQSAVLHAQAEAVQRDLAVMTERARLLKRQQVELEAETQPLQDQSAAQAERVRQAEAESAALSQQLAAHQVDIARAQEALTSRQAERLTLGQARRAAQDNAFRLASDATDRRNRRAQLAERKSELEREQAKHIQEQAQLQSELDVQRQTVAEVEADMAALAAQGNALKAQADAKAAEVAACQSRQVEFEEQLTQARAVETELRSRYEALGQVRAEMAGYDSGARAVLSARASVPGVRGAMASLVQVGDEWERAVESALGADAQDIIVDDWATAEAIAARNLGRATLLPLDAMRVLAAQRERAQREALEQQRRAQRQAAERQHREQLERAEQQRQVLRELTERQKQLQRELALERQRKQREMIEARRVAGREQFEQRQREMLAARPWWRKLVDRVFNIQPTPFADALRAAELELEDVVLYEPDAQVAEAIHAEIVSVVQDPEPVRPERVAGPPSSPWLAASSVVTCDEAIRPAVDALLGNVYLVQDMAEGQRSLPDLPPGARVVTRAGEVLHHSGAMTVGGGTGGGAGLLTREREWRELPAQLAAAQQRATQIETARDHEAKHQADLEREQAALLKSADDLAKRARSRTQERDVLVRAAERLDQQINWQAALVKQTQGELGAVAEKDQALAAELLALSAQQQTADDDIRAAEARLAALPVEELTSQLSQLKTSAAVASQAAQSQQAIVRNERSVLSQIDSQIAARGARAAQLGRESAELEERLGAQHAKQAEFSGQVIEMDALLQPAQAELGRLEAEQQIVEAQEHTARARLHEIESHHNAAVLEAGRREDELNNLRARIDEDLGLVQLDMTEATGPVPLPLKPIVDELPTVTELPEGVETAIQRRKAQLHRIGPISPEVQQEFKETQERYNFLTTQNEDLQKAIESLNHVIAELDELMRKAFVETFEAIAQEFKGTFNRLFGGGTAKMVLTEPDNPTTTGIDIVARPPGKRQQGLALLSGGERTLTAAALLFAILKVKPTPFCFLDEVDAALDEANVSRFRDMLTELSASTQFVVITHNRGTVEAADTIYGITMGTDSASRALSLKLEGETVAAAE